MGTGVTANFEFTHEPDDTKSRILNKGGWLVQYKKKQQKYSTQAESAVETVWLEYVVDVHMLTASEQLVARKGWLSWTGNLEMKHSSLLAGAAAPVQYWWLEEEWNHFQLGPAAAQTKCFDSLPFGKDLKMKLRAGPAKSKNLDRFVGTRRLRMGSVFGGRCSQ